MKCLTASFMCNQCTMQVYMCVYTQMHTHATYSMWNIRLSLLKRANIFQVCVFSLFFLEVWLCLKVLICFKKGFSVHLGAQCL